MCREAAGLAALRPWLPMRILVLEVAVVVAAVVVAEEVAAVAEGLALSLLVLVKLDRGHRGRTEWRNGS
jgi:hypothetical protein